MIDYLLQFHLEIFFKILEIIQMVILLKRELIIPESSSTAVLLFLFNILLWYHHRLEQQPEYTIKSKDALLVPHEVLQREVPPHN